MLKIWRVLAVSIVLSLVSCQCDTIFSRPVPYKHEEVLSAGIEKVKKDLALRDKLIRRGFDFNKAANIPELQAEMPILSAYYREAAKNRVIPPRPNKRGEGIRRIAEELEKVLKQMNNTFAQKSMSLHKWLLFHLQLGYLFSEDSPNEERYAGEPFSDFGQYGALDEAKLLSSNEVFFRLNKAFPSFVYSHDGSLGLSTLNFAFANEMQVIGAPTDRDVTADAQHLTPFIFMLHDINHFAAFSRSPYSYKRMQGQLKKVYEKIESQKKPDERLKDHLGLFFLSHEFPFNTSPGYLEDIRSIFQDTCLSQIAKNETFIEFVSLEEFDPLFKDLLQTSYLADSKYNNLKTICLNFIEKYAPFKALNKLPVQGPLNKVALEKALKAGASDTEKASRALKKLGFSADTSDADVVKSAKKQIAVRLLSNLGLSEREKNETRNGQVLLTNVRDIADWTLVKSRFDMKFFIKSKFDGPEVEITRLSDIQYTATSEASIFDPTVKGSQIAITVLENNKERAVIEFQEFGVTRKAQFEKNKLPDNLGPNIRAILVALGYNLDDPALSDALILMIDEFVKSIAKV